MKAVVFHGIGDRMGNCNHRKYIPHLIELVESGVADPLQLLPSASP